MLEASILQDKRKLSGEVSSLIQNLVIPFICRFFLLFKIFCLCDQPKRHAGVYHVSSSLLRVFRAFVFLSAARFGVFVNAVQL